MGKVIVVYTDCHSPSAKGDFSFAANLVKELLSELKRTPGNDIDLVLSSSQSGMLRYESLFGKPSGGRLMVDGISIRLSLLEAIDPVDNTVIAYIDANCCKIAPVDLVKRLVSPDCKFLVIGNANQPSWSGLDAQIFHYKRSLREQAALYQFVDWSSVYITSVGFGTGRWGLPRLSLTAELPPLTCNELAVIPKEEYGFIYLNAKGITDYQLIVQYIKLSGHARYVLIGNFNDAQRNIKEAYETDTTFDTTQIFPQIECYQAVSYRVMRSLVAGTAKSLVLSTGTGSVLEAMFDGKLTYYQNLDINIDFARSYLTALEDILKLDSALDESLITSIFNLAVLLFAAKPLLKEEMELAHALLNTPEVEKALIATNQKLIKQVTGTLASSTLNFLKKPRLMQDTQQAFLVCASLKRLFECRNPSYAQALIRAASWGRLLELKVLIKVIPKEALNKKDYRYHYTALHCAVHAQQLDCVRLLILAGADINARDKEGKTCLHVAFKKGNKALIALLKDAGAIDDLRDIYNHIPADYANSSVADISKVGCSIQ